MEGYLGKYKNFVSGYKKCYCRLEMQQFVILKGDQTSQMKVALHLRNAKVEVNPSQSKDFILTVDLNHTQQQFQSDQQSHDQAQANAVTTPRNQKLQKLYFQAKDPRDKDAWVKCLNQSIVLANQVQDYQKNNNNNGYSGNGHNSHIDKKLRIHHLGNKAIESHRDNLYEAFSSTLFIDECGINNQLSAFNEVESLFKTDMEVLLDMVKSTIDDEKSSPLIKKITGLKNLSKTMSSLIKNIVSEIDNTREQMFRILESYAAIEISNNPKQFNKKQQKISKSKQQLARNQNELALTKRFSIDDSSMSEKNHSKEAHNFNHKSSDHLFMFEEEEKSPNLMMGRSSAGQIQYSQSNGSQMDDSEVQFGIYEEEEIFQDASEEFIYQDQQVVKATRYFIQDLTDERISLPHMRNPNLKVSFWQVMKDLIGKDLTKVSMPIYFNEPISLGQRMAETVEYNYLLEQAAVEPNSLMRMALVATYTTTRYSSVIGRMQKPFNSLLGETFELVTQKYRYFSEQVCHHPPINAFHCENSFYEVFSQASTSMRFNGRSVLFAPKDRVYIKLKLKDGSQELYSVNLPATSVHNLIIGKIYVDVAGKSQVINHTTQETCDIELKEKGWSGKNANALVGIVKTSSGKPSFRIEGRYTQSLSIVDLSVKDAQPQEVWKITPKPEKSDWMYQYGHFTLQLNYLNDALQEKLPPTDSRLRPDQRALENGETELAIKEKHRLEEAQRARRRQMDKDKFHYEPFYFEKKLIEATGETIFQINGKYWEDRDKKDWSKLVRIFE
eukprot:403374240